MCWLDVLQLILSTAALEMINNNRSGLEGQHVQSFDDFISLSFRKILYSFYCLNLTNQRKQKQEKEQGKRKL